jgi:hypothetical protein
MQRTTFDAGTCLAQSRQTSAEHLHTATVSVLFLSPLATFPAFHVVNQLFVDGLFVHLYDRTVLFPAHCAVDLITVIALCRNRFLAKESLCVLWEGQQQVQQQSNQLQHGKLARRYRRNLNGHVQQMWSSMIPAARSSVELQSRGAAPCYSHEHYCMVFRGSWFKSCLECLF